MEAQTRIKDALKSQDPRIAVRALALALRTEGMKQAPMYRLFSSELERLAGEDPRYDIIADTMDQIWSGPWAKQAALFEQELTEDRLAAE